MFLIFHGPDEFSAQEKLHTLKDKLGDSSLIDLNTTELEGKNLNLGDLVANTQAMPFLAPKRVVIVYNFLSRFNSKPKNTADKNLLDGILDLLDNIPESTNLVFLESDTLKKSNLVLKKAMLFDKAVHLFDNPANLPRWISQRIKKKGGQIEANACQALAQAVGSNLRLLDNELEKLSLYVNHTRPITLADVELLCPFTADPENFAMANAIGRRDARVALAELHKQLATEKHPLAILAGISGQFRGLLEIKSLAEEGNSPQQIAKLKGWKSDYAVRRRLQEGNSFTTVRLIEIMNILLEADLAIKTGSSNQYLVLDSLIPRLCGLKD